MKNGSPLLSRPRRTVTCEDLARACSLSVWTTSLALNRHARVKSSTQERVAEMAARLGYAPNGAARRLVQSRFGKRSSRFDHAGFLLLGPAHATLNGPYLSLLHGAGQAFAGMEATMAVLNASDERGWHQAERMAHGGMVDGWLLVGDVTDGTLRRVRRWRQPFVVLGDHRVSGPIHAVNADHVAIGRLAVEHLAGLGHRRVGLMGTNLTYQYSRDLRKGFVSAVRDLGLDRDERLIQYLRGTESLHFYVSDLLRRLLAVKPRLTAIVIAESGHLQPVMNLIHQSKIRVPREISFVSCETGARAAGFPGAVQIQFPYEQVGATGAQLLKKLASHPRLPAQSIQLKPDGVQHPIADTQPH